MPRYLLRSSLLGCFAFLLLLNTASAQSAYRATESLYFKARTGLNTYGGDRDNNPGNELQKYIERIGFSISTEVGYHFSHSFDLGLIHISGLYPRIDENETSDGVPYPAPFYVLLDPDETSQWRHSLSLIGRFKLWSKKRVSPYAQLGLSLGFGKINGTIETGIAPIGAFGLDIATSDRVGIFLEVSSGYYFGDEKLDASDPDAFPGNTEADVSDFDALDLYSIGIRYTMKSPFVPVTAECIGPATLIPGESGTFAATINEDATRPVDLSWDFGDGTAVSGLGPHGHSFANPGPDEKTYTVQVTASNSKSTSTAVCPVQILAPPACTIAATPPRLDTCQQPLPAVQFSSTATGTLPITYRWDFGEPGATSNETNPSYTYIRDDVEPTMLTREATLRVSNAAGSAQCTAQVNIAQCPCNPDLVLGTSCFARHESVLPEGQARQNLQDNLDILQANPLTLILVRGFAQPNERNAQALADSRADAVAQFYLDNGINPSRIVKIGLVELEGAKTGPVCTQTRPFCDRGELDRYLEEQQQQYQQQDN